MNVPDKNIPLILVVENVEETRDGIEKLLKLDGYLIEPVRTVEEAVTKAKVHVPDLVLMCPTGSTPEVIRAAKQVRHQAALKNEIPFVIFCIEEVPEGEVVAVDLNIYLTRLNNFDQLRSILRQLLSANLQPF